MKPMVILTGPTAVGKTELSIRLAKILDAEIISADSMQVYKKMDIGTAKIMPEEMEGIKHYLVDELDPKEEFHVARFQQMAKDALKEIYAKGKIPLIVGGTGFYIQSLLYDIDFTKEDGDQEYRKQLEEKAKTEGNDSLYEMLKQVDPKQEKIPIQIVEEKAHSQVRDICVQVKAVLESITPELASDIMNQGIYVSGGGAAFPKTAEWIKEEFKIPVHIADRPEDHVIFSKT